jgi:AsmA protein
VLRADQIDVDRYLPPAGGSTEATSAGGPERKLGDIEITAEPLTATVIQGSASVGSLIIGGMRYEQLSANLAVGGGRASLSDVQTRLYGGEFRGGFSIDARGAAPAVHLTGQARQLALDPLLTAMLGDSNISGSGDFDLDLTGSGNTIGTAMQSAAGTMALTLSNGVLEGVNAGRTLCETINSLNGQPAPASAPNATAFSQIRGTATVADGTASTSDILVTTSYMQLTGRANMQLVDQDLSAKLVAQMTGPVELSGCERLNSRIDGSIPIGFTLDGKLPDVEVGFDVSQLLADWAMRELRNRAEESIRDRVLDRLLN